MATRLLPVEWRLKAAREFIDSLASASGTRWYAWFGNHMTSATIPDVYDDVLDTSVAPYRNMIMGKRVTDSDAKLMVRRVDYEANTAYDMYDDGDPLLFEKDFYVAVNAGSYSHVFKCLDNNNGSLSTTPPDFADIDSDDEVYQVGDGFRWKYMYSVTASQVARHGTTSYFPLVANTDVESSTVSRAIEVVKVEDGGEGYDNYLTGTFAAADVRVGGNTLLYGIASNTTASAVNGFYTGCVLYLSSGTGSGQYETITDYVSNSSGKYAVLTTGFPTAPTNGTEYQVYPEVLITGGGDQTSNAVARGLVNSVGNAIYRVEMLSRGEGYTYATAEVVANSVVGVTTEANVRPIFPPPGGHGSDAAAELGCRAVSVSVRLSNSESNTVPTTNGFRQMGLLRDPLFANVKLTFTGAAAGTFVAGETVYEIDDTVQIANAASTNSVANAVTCNTAWFSSSLSAGDWVYLRSENALVHQIAEVSSVTNSSHFRITANSLWSCTDVRVYRAELTGNCHLVERVSSNVVVVNSVAGVFETGSAVIGNTSGAYATIDVVERNGVAKSFTTFVQCHKYTGSYDSGTFTNDEYVYQGDSYANATATAFLHSAVSTGGSITVLTTNQVGEFVTSTSLKGANSGAVFTISSRYSPEVVPRSGRVVYIQNMSMVDRQTDQTEHFNVIFEL
jgi:hypothetical protein